MYKHNRGINKLMKKIFISYEEYPLNTLVPSIAIGRDGETVLSMLIITDDITSRHIKANKDKVVDIKTSCYTETDESGMGENLIIALQFFYSASQPIFRTIIFGDLNDEQMQFLEALKSVSEFIIWITDKKHQVLKVMTLNWDYEAHRKNLEAFIAGR
jgi:hypothetical protein